MAAVLEPLRPWASVADVTATLERWLRTSGWPGQKRAVLDYELAGHLRSLGASDPGIPTHDIVGITLFMLVNVAEGRGPTEDDMLGRMVEGVPARTVRHYRKLHGEQAFGRFLESLQRRLDVAALVRGGRTPTAARAWLRANPGMHAKDAPPSRQRAA